MGSRVDGGGRLIKRANRHALDPRCPSLINGTGTIKIIDGKACLVVNSDIQASMKDNVYECSACFSDEGLEFCTCSC